MPFYDYMYNTIDKSSDEVYERSLKIKEETPDFVHLTHMTTLQSTYHLRIGIASIASKPSDNSVWYAWMIWPVAWLSMILAWVYGSSAFVIERLQMKKFKMQTWAIPRYNFQVMYLFVPYYLMPFIIFKLLTIFFHVVWIELGKRIHQQLD
jgi:aldehyde decarbonylase